VPQFDMAQPPRDHAFVKTTKPKAAAAASIGAGLADRKRGELLGLLRPCFVRPEPWLQARKYVGALVSGLPKRNGWTVAEHVGDRTPDRTQRLLNRAAWETFAAMSVVRRFAVAGLEEAARRSGRQDGLVIGAVDETGQEKHGTATVISSLPPDRGLTCGSVSWTCPYEAIWPATRNKKRQRQGDLRR